MKNIRLNGDVAGEIMKVLNKQAEVESCCWWIYNMQSPKITCCVLLKSFIVELSCGWWDWDMNKINFL